MRHPLRVFALACALALTPSCAAMQQLTQTHVDNPVAAARTLDQRAYALLESYAALVEEAAVVAREASVPISVKRALGRAEAIAAPAAETLEIAVAAYVRARADYDAATSADATNLQRASAALAAAAQHLGEAIAAAQAPITDLETQLRAHR